MRRCRLCKRSIEGYPNAARYCNESGCLTRQGELKRERQKARNRDYSRRSRTKKREAADPLYGKGLRFCRCGADISHRSADQAYCEECVGNEWKRNQRNALRRELHQLHEMNPERWPVDILAKRYQLPLEQVQRWVGT